jgi:hypothetical protein
MKKKADLPTKLCPVCQRPFSWRKKWERCWDEVKYCSDKCRGAKKPETVLSSTPSKEVKNWQKKR